MSLYRLKKRHMRDEYRLAYISREYRTMNERRLLVTFSRSIFQQAGRLHSTYEWPLVRPLVVDGRVAVEYCNNY